jgi:hypothetical protein
MVSYPSGDPDPTKSWQDDGIDIEISQFDDPRTCLWNVYDHDALVRSGVCRTRWGAQIRSRCARVLYRWTAPD